MRYKNFQQKIIFVLILSLILSILSISCASNRGSDSALAKTIVIEHPERMFWEVKRGDASIFVLGTIHVADKNFYPLEENIIETFNSADELYSELGGLEEYKAMPLKIQKKMISSLNLEPEKNLSNFLSNDEIKVLYREFGKKNIEPLFSFEPWILAFAIPQMIYQKNGLDPSYGIDMFFISREKDIKIKALETIEDQLDVFSSESFDEQLKRLHESIETVKNMNQTMEEIYELKQAYLENDKQALVELLNNRTKIENGMTDEEYMAFQQKMLIDRNIAWAKIFNKLLGDGKESKKIFVFAGTGHFIGDNSVFDFLTDDEKKLQLVQDSQSNEDKTEAEKKATDENQETEETKSENEDIVSDDAKDVKTDSTGAETDETSSDIETNLESKTDDIDKN